MRKIILLSISILALSLGSSDSFATDGSCKDIEFVYARSSGAERNNSAE